MADAVVGSTLQFALEMLLSFATHQIGMVKEFKKDLESLRQTVDTVSKFLNDAEEKKVTNLAVGSWMKSLEALVCRAEHALDEVNYEMLRRRVEDRTWHRVLVSFFSSRNRIGFRLRMAHKLKHINTEFELINKKAETELKLQSWLVAGGGSATVPQSNTGSSSREKVSVAGQNVIGRKKDEELIVLKLLSQSNQLLTSIPIIGIGGLGKTTLAQSVYNNEQIVDQFDERIWVCVPQGYLPMDIFKLIHSSLPNESLDRDNKPLEVVVQKIKEKLKEKRYLLVLDDVWSGHTESSWGEFLGTLRGISTSAGNCIIVTTREVPVALIFCPRRDDHFSLEKLSDEDCLDIVKEKALMHEDSIQNFEAVREDIRKICQGVPLVARVIGGLLGTIPTKDWHSVLQKGISDMCGDEYYDIKQILQLSFNHLRSPSVKKCFTYCSLFEKGSTMQKKQLIELWMAEGFLQPKADHEDMEIGNECINSLLGSSLLQEVIEGGCEDVWMHDLVHDLVRTISKPTNDLKDVKEEDRYLVIDSFGEETKTLPKMRMLRTLFLRSGAPNNMFMMSFKHLHVLRLTINVKELPSSIGKLIHLRYLSCGHSPIKVLPESLCKLYNLQTLGMERCNELGAFPKGVTKLINLRRLHYDSKTKLPPKIGHLTSLQTLWRFDISEENEIKELGCLKNLRGTLSIFHLERVSSKEEALQADLNSKPVNILSFSWNGVRENENNDQEVLEGLQPHPCLQKLRIYCFSGNQFPAWFMNMAVCSDQNPSLSQRFDRLVSLTIHSCIRCKQLPALGQLPSLEYLDLWYLDGVSCIEPSFYGTDDRGGSRTNNISSGQVVPRKIFPALRILEVWSLDNLKEWMEYQTTNDEEVAEIFPKLEKLKISRCPQLSRAPIHYFRSLKHLDIDGTNLDHICIFPTVEKNQNFGRSPSSTHVEGVISTSLKSLAIKSCPNLKSLPNPTVQQCLTSLQKLTIYGFHGLSSLPHELLNSCASLTHLEIIYCNELSNLPADLLKSSVSLQHLDIKDLRNLESFSLDLQEMPSLSKLELYQLPKLITAPKSLGSRLSELKIGGFSDSVEVTFDWSVLSGLALSLRKLDLQNWPKLLSLPDQLQHLTALRELELYQLGQIEALPDWFANLVSLEKLELRSCEKLCYLPSVEAMRSLTKLSRLRIMHCPLLKERCTQRSGPNSEWAKISHIPHIHV